MPQALKPYPSYKPAKMPWLDQIPSHWDEKRAKYFFREVDERSKTGEEELLSVSHKTGITPRSEKNVTMFKAESYVGSKLCKPGDIVINTMWAWMAALGVSNHSGIVSPAYGVYRPLEEDAYSRLFLDNLLRTRSFVSEYICRSTGIRSSRLRLYPDQFLRIPFVYPPKEEQGIIEKYLRAKTTQIAKFIQAKRKLIALLNEQKQAIINQAVTRGLDANVRLKPSGVDYLGDIPEHWNVLKIKHVVKMKSGDGITALDFDDNGEYPVYGGNGFRGYTNRFTHDGQHILIGRQGALCGNVHLVSGKFWASEHAIVVTPKINVDYNWLYELFTLLNFNQYSESAAQPGISVDVIQNLYMPLPSFNEQKKISALLNSELSAIDSIVSKYKTEINLIREYRTRLISDVVTGKLDVRGIEVEDVDASEVLDDLDEAEDDVLLNEAEEGSNGDD